MRPNLLILGGTRDASALAARIAQSEYDAVLSYAGRTEAPRAQPIPMRTGGFGGVEGLAAYVRDNRVTHLIDATHPFADQMSRNAIKASKTTGVPLIALTRPAWHAEEGDRWTHVPDMDAAVTALAGAPQHIFLAIGRTEIARFAAQPQHHYLLRLADAPATPPPLPDHTIILDRGPFDADADQALLKAHRIERVVSKNSGGEGARAKLIAARALGMPVLMIDRPALPPRHEVSNVDDVMAWLAHDGTDLGV